MLPCSLEHWHPARRPLVAKLRPAICTRTPEAQRRWSSLAVAAAEAILMRVGSSGVFAPEEQGELALLACEAQGTSEIRRTPGFLERAFKAASGEIRIGLAAAGAVAQLRPEMAPVEWIVESGSPNSHDSSAGCGGPRSAGSEAEVQLLAMQDPDPGSGFRGSVLRRAIISFGHFLDAKERGRLCPVGMDPLYSLPRRRIAIRRLNLARPFQTLCCPRGTLDGGLGAMVVTHAHNEFLQSQVAGISCGCRARSTRRPVGWFDSPGLSTRAAELGLPSSRGMMPLILRRPWSDCEMTFSSQLAQIMTSTRTQSRPIKT